MSHNISVSSSTASMLVLYRILVPTNRENTWSNYRTKAKIQRGASYLYRTNLPRNTKVVQNV